MNKLMKALAAAMFVMFVAVAAFGQAPCATASKFGPNDQIGNMNNAGENARRHQTRYHGQVVCARDRNE